MHSLNDLLYEMHDNIVSLSELDDYWFEELLLMLNHTYERRCGASVTPNDSFEEKAAIAAIKDLKRSVPDWEQRVVWIVLACSDYQQDIDIREK